MRLKERQKFDDIMQAGLYECGGQRADQRHRLDCSVSPPNGLVGYRHGEKLLIAGMVWEYCLACKSLRIVDCLDFYLGFNYVIDCLGCALQNKGKRLDLWKRPLLGEMSPHTHGAIWHMHEQKFLYEETLYREEMHNARKYGEATAEQIRKFENGLTLSRRFPKVFLV